LLAVAACRGDRADGPVGAPESAEPPPSTTGVPGDGGAPSADGGMAPVDAGYSANPATGRWADAFAPIEPLSPNDDSIPSLLIEPGGAVDLAVHRMVETACLICTANRIVSRWDGAQWKLLDSASGRPGSGSQPTALAWDPVRQAPLLADGDLTDPYHPPVPARVFVVGDQSLNQIGVPFGIGDTTTAQSIAVDATGTATVAWSDSGTIPLHVTRIDQTLSTNELPPPTTAHASGGSLQLDASGRAVLAWCGGGTVGLSTWDPDSGAWQHAADLGFLNLGSACSVSLALDASGRAILAYWTGDWQRPAVHVIRWDGHSWTSLGDALGNGPTSLVFTSRGTPLLATSAGIQELTDTWRVVDPSSGPNTQPIVLATANGLALALWKREATTTQSAGWFFRALRW
jgi:hypothetical protein